MNRDIKIRLATLGAILAIALAVETYQSITRNPSQDALDAAREAQEEYERTLGD